MNQLINQPLVSVILPVRNAEKYLMACLDSLSSQTYNNLEIIAIDDFSVDDSYTILKNYRKIDRRIKIFRNVKHYGMAVTLNRALKKTRGQYVAFMKAEDITYKEKLIKQVAYLEGERKTVAVGVQSNFTDEQNKRIGKSEFPTAHLDIYKKPLHGVSVQFESIMINRHLIPKDLLYFHTNQHPYLYADILVKLLQYGKLANLPYYLYNHRKFGIEKQRTNFKEIIMTIKLWFRSEALFGYRPDLRTLFSPLLGFKVSA